jgi:hypothetical protein
MRERLVTLYSSHCHTHSPGTPQPSPGVSEDIEDTVVRWRRAWNVRSCWHWIKLHVSSPCPGVFAKPNYEHLPWPPPVMSFSHGWRSELPSRMDILSLVDDGACWDDWDCAVMLAGLWIQACGDCRCESRKCILQLTENREYKGQTAVRQTCEGRAEVGVMWLLVLIMQEEGCQPGITCGHCKLEKTSAPWGRNHVCFAAGPSRGLRFNQCFIKERTNESSLPDCTKVGKLKQM